MEVVEYKVIQESTTHALQQALNSGRADRWEPVTMCSTMAQNAIQVTVILSRTVEL
jgi:hypothetical protein